MIERAWANASLRVKGLVCVALPTLALVVAVVSYAIVAERQNEAQLLLSQTLQVQRDISKLTTEITDAESGVRGYALTGAELFLEPYEAAIRSLPETLARLEELVAGNPEQLARLQRARTLANDRLDLLAALVEERAASDEEPSGARLQALVLEGRGFMELLRGVLADMQAEERARLDAAERAVSGSRSTAQIVILSSAVVGLLGGLVAILLFTSGVVRRAQRLEDNARRMDAGEDLIPLDHAADEIGRLGTQIESTAALLRTRGTELAEARRFLEQLIASSPVIIFRRDAFDGSVKYVSPNVRRLLGYTPEEVMAEKDFWPEHVHPADRPRFESEAERALEEGRDRVERDAYRFKDKRGSYRWLESVVQIEREMGEPTALLCFALDVTNRKAAEQSLADRELTLSAILDTSPDIIAILDIEGRRRYLSPSVELVLGHDSAEIARLGFTPLIHPDDRRLAAELTRRALETEDPVKARYRMRHADGHWLWLDVRARRIDAPGGPGDAVIVAAREVSAQVELEQALRQAKDEAERSNSAKSDFLSRMSHELRTPLNAVLGFAQILQMESVSPQQRDSIEEILRGGRHLLDLINEVLDIARIETGRLSLSIEPVPLTEVVRESLGLVRPLAAQRSIHLVIPDVDPRWHALADRQRLKQVLLNLLSNAVKYNSPRGKVQLECSKSETGTLVLTVADTGPGIPGDQMDRLFSPFERLGAEQTGVEGTGLGLALSKRLVEAMGGTISVWSSDAGSRFTVELALVDGPLERVAVLEPPAVEPQEGAPRRRVLYVEDNLSNLKLIEHLFARRPEFTLDATMQGRLGVELAREHRPDLILLDLNLPDVSGQEVLALLRDDHRTRDIPVVVITADASDGQAERLRRAGAMAYLTKPLDIRLFLEVLDKAVSEGRSQESWPL